MKTVSKNIKDLFNNISIIPSSIIMPKYVLEASKINSLINEEKHKLILTIGEEKTKMLFDKLIKESKEQLGVNSEYVLNGLISAQYKP